jgi:hypothetical protein
VPRPHWHRHRLNPAATDSWPVATTTPHCVARERAVRSRRRSAGGQIGKCSPLACPAAPTGSAHRTVQSHSAVAAGTAGIPTTCTRTAVASPATGTTA